MNKRDEAVLEELAEYGTLHSEDCCVHFPEDSRACDVNIGVVDCCENMRTFSFFLLQKLQEERERIAGEVEKCKNIIDGHGHENYNDPSMCIPCYGREIDEHENNGIDRAISIIKSK